MTDWERMNYSWQDVVDCAKGSPDGSTINAPRRVILEIGEELQELRAAQTDPPQPPSAFGMALQHLREILESLPPGSTISITLPKPEPLRDPIRP